MKSWLALNPQRSACLRLWSGGIKGLSHESPVCKIHLHQKEESFKGSCSFHILGVPGIALDTELLTERGSPALL